MLPLPLYWATCGYGHSGRVRSTLPAVECDATIEPGALPVSTQASSGPTLSKSFGPSPPPQCAMPGAMNRRYDGSIFGCPPSAATTRLKYATLFSGEIWGSAQP